MWPQSVTPTIEIVEIEQFEIEFTHEGLSSTNECVRGRLLVLPESVVFVRTSLGLERPSRNGLLVSEKPPLDQSWHKCHFSGGSGREQFDAFATRAASLMACHDQTLQCTGIWRDSWSK